jgi:hypothetical protein
MLLVKAITAPVERRTRRFAPGLGRLLFNVLSVNLVLSETYTVTTSVTLRSSISTISCTTPSIS